LGFRIAEPAAKSNEAGAVRMPMKYFESKSTFPCTWKKVEPETGS